MDDQEFWRAVSAYMTDPATMKRLGLDTVYTSEIERPTGMACWCRRASKTLTHRFMDLVREHGRDGYEFWFIGVAPPEKWPTDLSFRILVVDDTFRRKVWGLHELAGLVVDEKMFVREHAVVQ